MLMPPAYQSAVCRPSGWPAAARSHRPDHREAHDGVPQHDGDRLAVLEDVGHPGREEQRTDHDHEGEQPEDDVVVVVGRREPRVVHPGPPDREPGHRVAEHRAVVRLGQPVVQLGGVARDRDDEDQVEEQLERGRGPVPLARVARHHGSAQRNRDDAHEPSMPPGQLREVRLARPTPTSTAPTPSSASETSSRRSRSDPVRARSSMGTTSEASSTATQVGQGFGWPPPAVATLTRAVPGAAVTPHLDGQRSGGVVDHDGVGVLAGDRRRHDAARPARAGGAQRRHPLGERVGDDDRRRGVVGPLVGHDDPERARPSDWAVSSLSTTSALQPLDGGDVGGRVVLGVGVLGR